MAAVPLASVTSCRGLLTAVSQAGPVVAVTSIWPPRRGDGLELPIASLIHGLDDVGALPADAG